MTDLETLIEAITKEAEASATLEWHTIHWPALCSVLRVCRLTTSSLAAAPGVAHGSIKIDGRDIPAGALVNALCDIFMSKRTKELQEQLTRELVMKANRAVREKNQP